MAKGKGKGKGKSRRSKRGPFPNIPVLTERGKISLSGLAVGHGLLTIATGRNLYHPDAGVPGVFWDVPVLISEGRTNELPKAWLDNAKNAFTTGTGAYEIAMPFLYTWAAGKVLLPLAPRQIKRWVTS